MITYLIPCSGPKAGNVSPARDLYTGTTFTNVLDAAEKIADADRADRETVQILIVSALYGLIDLDATVAPYDVKMGDEGSIEAEELGITQANAADEAASSENPVVQRLLGVTPEGAEPFDSGLGLEPDWVVTMISAVGNYGEIYDRNLGPGTPFELERGLNNLWSAGGLLYAPPYR